MAARKLTSTNNYNRSYLEDKCPLNELIHLMSKRWMTEVLFSIEEGNNRFNHLKDDLEHISDHILASRLRHLESYGLITRSAFEGIPVRIEYCLTPYGTEFSDILGTLCTFAEKIVKS